MSVMALTSLLVCADAKDVQVLSRILTDMDIRVEHSGDANSALANLGAVRMDAVILDCLAEAPALELIACLRKSPVHRTTIIIGLVEAANNVREIFARGANFILYKPISPERAASSMRAARGLMSREKRQSPRLSLQAPASISFTNVENAAATLLDLSERGVAMQSERKLPPRCKVYFQFALPGDRPLVRLSGEVTWQDASGRVGIRFVDVPQTSRRLLNDWIKANLASAVTSKPLITQRTQEPRLGETTTVPSTAGNRRNQGRQACCFGAEVLRVGTSVPYRCTLSDIGSGGCYVETTEPFSTGTNLEIVVRTQEVKVRLRGLVQTVHPGVGMGVKFALQGQEQRDQLQLLMSLQAAQSSTF